MRPEKGAKIAFEHYTWFELVASTVQRPVIDGALSFPGSGAVFKADVHALA